MTDTEVNIYNYLLAKEGKGSADEYLGFLVETLNYRQGTADAEALDGNIVGQLLYSIPAGLVQFGSGIRQLFSKERVPTSVAQFTSNAIYEDLADDGFKLPDWLGGGSITQWLYSYGTTMGNMLPSIALTVATGGLGAPAALAQGVGALTMGLSAKGNAYNWALQQGYTKEQAESYSTFVGVSEAGLQYIMGGISAFGGIDADGIVTKLFPKVSNGLLKAGLKLVVKSAGEGVEEYLQTIFEPVYRNMAFGENNEFLLYSDEAMASFFMGVFTAGTIEGGFAIKTGITATKAGGVVMESNNYDTLLQHALALDPETEAYKLANQLSGNKVKASNYNVGTLLMEYVKETGSASFMYTPRPEVKADTNTETDIRLDAADTINPNTPSNSGQNSANTITELTDSDISAQIEQAVTGRIQQNATNTNTSPSVQAALIEGMTTLTKNESRIKSDSGIANHQGINIDTSHNAYMDFSITPGTIADSPAKRAMLGNAATAMAADIGRAIATGQLSAAEVSQLQGVLAGLTGDAELAARYVGQVVAGADAISANVESGKVSANVDESNPDLTEQEADNSVENPTPIDYNLVKEYIHDIEERTGIKLHKKQIEELKNALRNKEYKRLSPSELSQHRKKFNGIKERLIAQWEKNTGQKWPIYEEDVISNRTGEPIRRAGQHYDAHHIIEAGFNGDNAWWNIHPARYPDIHQAGIHGAGSPANQLF